MGGRCGLTVMFYNDWKRPRFGMHWFMASLCSETDYVRFELWVFGFGAVADYDKEMEEP